MVNAEQRKWLIIFAILIVLAIAGVIMGTTVHAGFFALIIPLMGAVSYQLKP